MRIEAGEGRRRRSDDRHWWCEPGGEDTGEVPVRIEAGAVALRDIGKPQTEPQTVATNSCHKQSHKQWPQTVATISS